MKRFLHFVVCWVRYVEMDKQGQNFSQDLGRGTQSVPLNLWSDSFTSALMFSRCHLVWWLQSPRDSPKQSDFPEISIKPNIESARIPISHSLQLDPVFNHWPYLDQKRVIYPLLVRCLLYFIRFFIYFPIVFLSSVPGRRYRQIAYWSFWMLSENPKISCSLFTLLGCLSPSLWFLHR